MGSSVLYVELVWVGIFWIDMEDVLLFLNDNIIFIMLVGMFFVMLDFVIV